MMKNKYRVVQNGFYKIESWERKIVNKLQQRVSGKGLNTKLVFICKNRNFKFHCAR